MRPEAPLIISLVADSKALEKRRRKCSSCNLDGHDVRNCPQLSEKEKSDRKASKKQKAEREKNMAEPKSGRSDDENVNKKGDGDEFDAEMERHNVEGANPFVDQTGEALEEEEDEGRDDLC